MKGWTRVSIKRSIRFSLSTTRAERNNGYAHRYIEKHCSRKAQGRSCMLPPKKYKLEATGRNRQRQVGVRGKLY